MLSQMLACISIGSVSRSMKVSAKRDEIIVVRSRSEWDATTQQRRLDYYDVQVQRTTGDKAGIKTFEFKILIRAKTILYDNFII